MSNVTKLTASNFLMWNRQIRALLAGYGLAHFLDGSGDTPAPTVLVNGVSANNPKFILWQRQDQLIYSSLLGAISVEIKYWKKGTRSIDEYFQGFATWSDQLALLGKPYELEEQVDHLLSGLPEEYKPIIDQIDGRETPPSLTEIHEKPINYELKLNAQAFVSSSVPITANAVYSKSTGSSPHFRTLNRSHACGYHHNSNRCSQGRGYNGRCQLCGVFGHNARWCSQLPSGGNYQPSGGNYHSSGGG
ncbi:PREDICTED: uncharacterized protein LOC104705629 [Camelina sativa]|uniref:Uncharacterized protein LOC104705629 n=1 Tax=Camelina sativa TaxID=90675 RepID=A0ABM0T2L0_CAMSA|nr:PREDICTED: uncharacterized protein LOC104705629 [Camelina sativa]